MHTGQERHRIRNARYDGVYKMWIMENMSEYLKEKTW